jgi:hypothetical protein
MITALATVVAAADRPPRSTPATRRGTLMASALVLLMTPALAFFYGGLVRRKNVLSVLMQCFLIMCLVSIQWVLLKTDFSTNMNRRKSKSDLPTACCSRRPIWSTPIKSRRFRSACTR